MLIVPFQNGDQITNFYFASFPIWEKKIPKEFFNEFWLVVRQHVHINIDEIKIENIYSK